MKSAFCVFVITLLLSYSSNGQRVYSVGVYSAGRTYERDYLIGSSSNQWGFSQYSQWEDTNGFVIINAGHERELGGVQRCYTTVRLGPTSFNVRGAARSTALMFALFAAVSIAVAGFGFRNVLRHLSRKKSA